MKAVAVALMLVASAAQAEPALTNRATELLAQAQSDAARLVSLPENSRVEVVKRSGAWSEVKTATGQAGWLRMMHLKSEGNAGGSHAQKPSTPKAGGALASLLGSGRTTNNATVTTGVRGLQEEDLQRARPNPEELKKMQKLAVARDAAQAFAQRSKLVPAHVDYLEPVAPAPAGTGGDSGNAVPGLSGG